MANKRGSLPHNLASFFGEEGGMVLHAASTLVGMGEKMVLAPCKDGTEDVIQGSISTSVADLRQHLAWVIVFFPTHRPYFLPQ